MFPQQPQQQFRTTNANVQLFYRDSTWNKPPGCSQIYMMLIGGGGAKNSATGGGSGAVTTWWGSAQNVPDNLVISVSTGDNVDTLVQFYGANGVNTLLTADGANANTAGAAMTANQFCASGFFQSVAGQAGTSGAQSASTSTFLSGGSGSSNTVTANYGYAATANDGYFLLQPIIVGVGNSRSGGVAPVIGCGQAGGPGSTAGGPGLVIIAAW